jgi:hypothetical protein
MMNKETLFQEENVNLFFNLFNRGTDDQRRLFLHHYERLQEEQDSLKKKKTKQVVKQEQKEQKAKDLLLTQTRLSLSEFQERILQKLKPTRIKLLLRQTRCSKLYRLLYGDISKIDLEGDDIFDPAVQKDEAPSEEKSCSVSQEEYLKIFISVLKNINTPLKKCDERMNFHTFTDACWEAVEFDTLSTGLHQLVFAQETCPLSSSYLLENLLKPNKLRKLCIDHIKQFFIEAAQLELQDIDAALVMQMDDEFKGLGNIMIFIYNFHCYFHVNI